MKAGVVLVLLFAGVRGLQGQASLTQTTTTLAITQGGVTTPDATVGAAITLTATVKAGAELVTQGQVAFCDAAAKSCTDVHLLGVAQLTAAGTATLTLTPGIGQLSYEAEFLGTPDAVAPFQASDSTPQNLLVGGGSTATTVTQTGFSSATLSYILTTTVVGSGSSTYPTGSVDLVDGHNPDFGLTGAGLNAKSQALQFSPHATGPGSGSGSLGLVIGDFNHDGKLDFVFSEAGESGDLELALGNGDGTFQPSVKVGSPAPVSLVAGDFNGDGKMDLAVAYANAAGGKIFLGEGDGTFTSGAAIAIVGNGPSAMVAGDFNQDGNLDVAVTNQGDGTVSVFLGDGQGNFVATAASPATGSMPVSLVTGDFDGDGKLDLAVANSGGDSVTVLIGAGDGTFTAAATVATGGTTPGEIAAGDFNGDGVLDLAVSNSGSNNLSIATGKGDGTFNTAVLVPAGRGPRSVVVADFNRDGIPDLAVTNSGDNDTSILLGDGKGGFKSQATRPATGTAPSFAVAGDLNSDGVADLMIGSEHGGGFTALTTQLTATSEATGMYVSYAFDTMPYLGEQLIGGYGGDGLYDSSQSPTTDVAVEYPAPPVITPSSGSYAPGQMVTITDTSAGIPIYYTTDGSMPTLDENGAPFGTTQDYYAPIQLNATTTIKAVDAIYSPTFFLLLQSPVASATYTIQTAVTPAVVLTPSATQITTAQGITIVVAVNAASGKAQPTGIVTLSGGGFTAKQTLTSGATTFTIAAGALAAGNDLMTAMYAPDTASAPLYTSATQTVTIDVAPAIGTAVAAITVTPATLTITDKQIENVAVVLAGGSGMPSGSVTLTSGTFTAQQTLSGGTATFQIPMGSLSVGTDTLTASYTGDAVYAPVTGSATITVAPIILSIPAPAAIAPGATATETANILASSTYSGTINLTCTLAASPTGAQSLPTCNVNPASVAISAGGSGTSMLTIQTTAASTTSSLTPLFKMLGGGTALAVVLLLGIPARRRRGIGLLSLLLVAGAITMIGCGGHSTPMAPPVPGTTAGTYTFTVVAADSIKTTITSSSTVTLIVQ